MPFCIFEKEDREGSLMYKSPNYIYKLLAKFREQVWRYIHSVSYSYQFNATNEQPNYTSDKTIHSN